MLFRSNFEIIYPVLTRALYKNYGLFNHIEIYNDFKNWYDSEGREWEKGIDSTDQLPFIMLYLEYYKTKQSTSIFKLNTLYTSPARLGYGIMVLSFFITLAISWFNGEPLYFQRLFAIVGYGCLALKIDIGLFFVIGFYIFNLILAPKITINDYIYATSKVGLIVYFSTYAYQFILDEINKNKKDKQKQE